ncbi:MAG TPA: type II toxin-antitoxin system death-on-curing family toxin [Pseudolysinimonas sp.]|nr:type II toxin-antitoxin system death-on-curing family toxin [Pseudolysinimonas sp.]
MTRYLSLEDATQVVARLGFTMRDAGLLGSALARPATTLSGVEAYGTVARKAAALLESVVRNHALIDGNKRLGWVLTSLFLWTNNVTIEVDADDAFDLVVGVSAGRYDLDQVEERISRMLRG